MDKISIQLYDHIFTNILLVSMIFIIIILLSEFLAQTNIKSNADLTNHDQHYLEIIILLKIKRLFKLVSKIMMFRNEDRCLQVDGSPSFSFANSFEVYH